MLQLLHHTTSLLYTPRKCDICPTYARTSTDKLVTHVALCREKCYSYYTILLHCSTHPESATYARTSTHKLVMHVALCREKCYSYYTILLHCSTHPESATYVRTSTDKLVMHVALCREKCYSYYTILLHCSTHPESATYVRHMPVHRQTSSSSMSRCVVKSVTVITPYYFTALHTPKVRHMSDICPYIDRQARHACRAVS